MINISEEATQQIHEDALQSFPYECCGFLFGHEKDETRTITKIKRVNNISNEDQRRRFTISATDYIQAEEYAEVNNLSLLGIYHSHPNHPSVPSETDRISAQPFFSYVIISVIKDIVCDASSWRLNEQNQFEEEKINQAISPTIKIN
jgi:proteasome lid subunit RPN8/RPN11